MTIEELLEMSADRLEAMSQQEVEEFFKPFWPICRPELVKKPDTGSKKYRVETSGAGKSKAISELRANAAKGRELLKKYGFNVT